MTYRGIIYFLKGCGLRTSFTREGGKMKRCYRWGEGEDAAKYQGAPFPQEVPPGEKWQNAKVFAVSIPQKIVERWSFQRPFHYLCATSEAAAVESLDKKFRKIILGSQKLAKSTLGVGASKVAEASGTGRISAGAAKTARVRQASNKYSDARVWMNGEEFGVRMDSNLCYALDAVTGGTSAIDFAVRKSMNKIAGYINSSLTKEANVLGGAGRRMLTPFRDIVGRRS